MYLRVGNVLVYIEASGGRRSVYYIQEAADDMPLPSQRVEWLGRLGYPFRPLPPTLLATASKQLVCR